MRALRWRTAGQKAIAPTRVKGTMGRLSPSREHLWSAAPSSLATSARGSWCCMVVSCFVRLGIGIACAPPFTTAGNTIPRPKEKVSFETGIVGDEYVVQGDIGGFAELPRDSHHQRLPLAGRIIFTFPSQRGRSMVRECTMGTTRFDDFQHRLGIARNVLTARLNRLIDNGVLVKVLAEGSEQRTEYRLTKREIALPGARRADAMGRRVAWTPNADTYCRGQHRPAPRTGKPARGSAHTWLTRRAFRARRGRQLRIRPRSSRHATGPSSARGE